MQRLVRFAVLLTQIAVALQVDATVRGMLYQEAIIMSELRHPCIARVYGGWMIGLRAGFLGKAGWGLMDNLAC
jgi:hypothetical protein